MDVIADILVIEPDDISVLILKRSFYNAGYSHNFIVAETWEAAKIHFNKPNIPKLILIEPVLPDCSTKDALAWMYERDVFQRSDVYFLSAILLELLTDLCTAFPHKGCLSKPIRKEDINKIMLSLP